MAPCRNTVPCQLRPVVRRHSRGVLWAGGDPCMTECLECSLARPVLAQSWSQTTTDGDNDNDNDNDNRFIKHKCSNELL